MRDRASSVNHIYNTVINSDWTSKLDYVSLSTKEEKELDLLSRFGRYTGSLFIRMHFIFFEFTSKNTKLNKQAHSLFIHNSMKNLYGFIL